jgi:Na+-transporting NADH:ubiquinone oxidoreductase subunit C
MDKDSNKFTFLFAAIMVIVIAILLSVAAIGLGPYQARNTKIEKMENILSSIGIIGSSEEAEENFSKYITKQVVLDSKGEPVSGGTPAFDIDLKKELDKSKTGDQDKELFPLFVCQKENKTFYIIPVRGKGLWGPIWGFIALEEDMNTVYGVSFGHKSETPGLGAEIENIKFQEKFKGKKILDDEGKFVSVKVLKGSAGLTNPHGIDAVSGATITSDGVSEMLERTLSNYIAYFKKISTQP